MLGTLWVFSVIIISMRSKTKNVRFNNLHPSKKLLILMGSVLVLLLCMVVLEATGVTNFFGPSKQLTTAQKETAKTDAATKKQLTQNQPSGSPDKSGASSTTYAPPRGSDNIKLSAEQASTRVTIKTQLYGYSDGTCTLRITNTGKTFTQTASVIFQSQFSTCAGFSVPISQLETGTWNITITVDSQGVTASNTTTLEVK